VNRGNIANAVLFGLQKDLKLTGSQYNAALLTFFIPYIVFDIPSNLVLRKLRPRTWCKF